jgi:hypothetical protein
LQGSAGTDYRLEIEKLFEEHNPSKLEGLDKLMLEWAGREDKLLANMQRKYAKDWRGNLAYEKPVLATVDPDKLFATVQRLCMAYLMVGYIFLSGNALEPFSCRQDFDGISYMTAATDIACTMCDPEYLRLRIGAIIGTTVYGFGSPLMFFLVLWTSKTNNKLKTKEFAASYGFLSTKMREEDYAW